MATLSQHVSGIPQPKTRGPSRLMSMQAQFQQRAAADRQKKLAELTPPPQTDRSATTAPARTTVEPGLRAAAPRATAPPRRRATAAAAPAAARSTVPSSVTSSVSPGVGGRGRITVQTARRAGPAPQPSPVGWDKSYPLDPMTKKSTALGGRQPLVSNSAPPSTRQQPSSNGPSTHHPPASVNKTTTGGGRVSRPEAAPEPRRSAPSRAAPSPSPTAVTAASRMTSSAKENQAPTPRPPPSDPSLAQCEICSRAFAKDRLEKHQVICEKASKKKRKVFDPVKMRVQGTESEAYLRKQKNAKQNKEKVPAKKDWRKQHEEFIRNIRAAKKAQAHLAAGGSIKDLPPPPPMDTSDYVQCPHCSRRFNEAAADRHIPKCASISCNKPAAGGGRVHKPAARGAAVARTRR